MLVLAETTVWSDGLKNGVYIMNDQKTQMYAFAKYGSSEFKWFKKPLSIDTRRREFIQLYKAPRIEPPAIESPL